MPVPGEFHYDTVNYLTYKRIVGDKRGSNQSGDLEKPRGELQQVNEREGTPPKLKRTKKDGTEVGGVCWTELRPKLKNPTFKEEFTASLSIKDKEKLLKLATEEE